LFSLDVLINMASIAGMAPIVKLSKPKLVGHKRAAKTGVAVTA